MQTLFLTVVQLDYNMRYGGSSEPEQNLKLISKQIVCVRQSFSVFIVLPNIIHFQ